MTGSNTIQATLYMSDPRSYASVISKTRLTSNDAYLDVVEFNPTEIDEEHPTLNIQAIESSVNSKPLLPIHVNLLDTYRYLEAFGFFYRVLKIKPGRPNEYEILIIYDNRDAFFQPITAIFDKNKNEFELTFPWNYGMKNHYALLWKNEQRPKIIPLQRKDDGSRVFEISESKIKLTDGELAGGEEVEILLNYDSSVRYYIPRLLLDIKYYINSVEPEVGKWFIGVTNSPDEMEQTSYRDLHIWPQSRDEIELQSLHPFVSPPVQRDSLSSERGKFVYVFKVK